MPYVSKKEKITTGLISGSSKLGKKTARVLGSKKSKEPLSPSKRIALRIQKEDIASGETAAAKAFMTRNLPYTGDIHGKSRIIKKKKKDYTNQ